MQELTPSSAQEAPESFPVGTWLSLVEHSLGVRGVGSSNLPVPTNHSLVFCLSSSFFPSSASSFHFANCDVIVTCIKGRWRDHQQAFDWRRTIRKWLFESYCSKFIPACTTCPRWICFLTTSAAFTHHESQFRNPDPAFVDRANSERFGNQVRASVSTPFSSKSFSQRAMTTVARQFPKTLTEVRAISSS